MDINAALCHVVRLNPTLTGDCIRTLFTVYELPMTKTYNLKDMAEEIKVERRSVRRHVDQLAALGLVTYRSGRIWPVNIIQVLQVR